jgi:endoglucanase
MSSGDEAWTFDFSSVTTAGDYFVLDETNTVRSDVFTIADGVYRDVLTQAVRMYYYQRDGIAKDATYAGTDWADGFAHPQDTACGLYSDRSAPLDLHGGWFDAGDRNRYTNWGASDVIELLRAYVEAPGAFTDDTNIPESGNGIPDLLDEAKWEIDWITRMQTANGSVLSIAGHVGASPPSTDASPCKYGPANTSATLTSAAMFAYASIVFEALTAAGTAYPRFADDLATRAGLAWTWAEANPDVTFYNSQNGVGAGEQEVDDTGRLQKKVQAATFLFELTGMATYKTFFDANYAGLETDFDPFHMEQLDTLLEYTKATGATSTVVSGILSKFKNGVEGGNYAGPALVYLSNMGSFGANTSVTRFFHSWFGHGTEWDAVGVSMYGPPPGYLPGGPNPSYAWDSCCPAGCGSAANNALCGVASPTPPRGQPDQKAYKDFNDSWPLDSWQVTEPDDGYQAQFVRLLSKFVR